MPELPALPVPPLRYHADLVEHLERQEAELFAWFAEGAPGASQAEAVRLELLKSTYRLDPEAHPAVHEAARDAAARLGVAEPLQLYQGPGDGTLNASVAYLPGEVHLVPPGSQLMGDDEPPRLRERQNPTSHLPDPTACRGHRRPRRSLPRAVYAQGVAPRCR